MVKEGNAIFPSSENFSLRWAEVFNLLHASIFSAGSYPPLAFASVLWARFGEAWITPLRSRWFLSI
jgi:hypothetical protein